MSTPPSSASLRIAAEATRSVDPLTATGERLERLLVGGMFWTIVGAAASRGAILVASLILARLLGRVTFGELGVIESSVGMFAILANMGLSLTSTKFVAKYRRVDPVRAGRVLGLCCAFAAGSAIVLGAVVVLAAPWLAGATLGAPHLAGALRLAAVILALSSINGALTGALIGFQAFRELAKVNLITGALTIPMLAGAASAGGLHGAVLGLIAVQALSTIFLAVAVRRVTRASGAAITLRGSWAERGLLASFSLPALVNSSLRSPVNWLCIAMLVNQPGGYAEMGLLHAVNPWFLLLMFLPGQLANVYFPMFEDALARGRRDEVRRLMWRSMQLNLLVCAALAAVVAVWAEGVLAWYGPGYGEGTWVLRVSVLTGLVIAVQQPLSAYLVSVATMWAVTACSVAWAAAFIVASYGLLSYGALGVAGARLVGCAVYAVMVAAIALPNLKGAARGAGTQGLAPRAEAA